MFLEEELLTIVVHYKKIGRHYVAYDEKTFEEMKFTEDETEDFKTLTIKARQLTWGLYNTMQETAMVPDELGNRKWNYKVYKENKLRRIIAKWDAKIENEEGEMVNAPPSPQMIAKMAPEVAEVILDTYDRMTMIDEDNEKKS